MSYVAKLLHRLERSVIDLNNWVDMNPWAKLGADPYKLGRLKPFRLQETKLFEPRQKQRE